MAFEFNQQSVIPGFNWGGSGFPNTTGWYGTTDAFTCFTDIYSQGMSNILGTDIRKFSTGDLNGIDLNVQTRGGQVDPAAEGVSMIRPYLNVGIAPYTAVIATGGAQATTLQMASVNDRTAGVGQTLLDMSAIASCNVLSIMPGGIGGGGSYAALETDGTFTPSQTVTLAATSLAAVNDSQNAGTIQTLQFNVTTPIQAGALIKLGGEFPEAIRVLSADPVLNGTQNVTASVRAQHWAGTVGMIGGPAGMYMEQTKYTKNGLRFVSHVLGAKDAKTLLVFNDTPGGMDPGYLFPGPVKLYQGAAVTDVRDAGNNVSTDCVTLQLEANNGVWPVGGNVEQPNHATAWWQTYVSFVSSKNPFATGTHFLVSGNGSAFGSVGGGKIFRFINHEPASSYTQNGGQFTPSTGFEFNGTFGSMFTFDTQPAGPLFLIPADSPLSLIAIRNHTAYINYDTANGNNGEWTIEADQVNVPGASFSNAGHVLNQFTTIQGCDGAGTPSLTLKAPVNSNFAQQTITSLHCEGRAIFDGEVIVDGQPLTAMGIQGPQGPKGDPGPQGPQGPAGPSDDTGFTGTKKIGGVTYTFKNGRLQ